MDTSIEDLEEQIRSALRHRAEQLPRAETSGGEATRRPAHKVTPTRAFLVAAAAVVLVTVVVVGFTSLRSTRTDPTVEPARHAAMQALTTTGPADCASVTKAGEANLLSVTVTGGHAICVTQHGNSTDAYFDGTYGGGMSGTTPLTDGNGQGVWSIGGLATTNGRFYVLANLLNNAGSLRLTFCNGKTLDLHPLNTTNPKFVNRPQLRPQEVRPAKPTTNRHQRPANRRRPSANGTPQLPQVHTCGNDQRWSPITFRLTYANPARLVVQPPELPHGHAL